MNAIGPLAETDRLFFEREGAQLSREEAERIVGGAPLGRVRRAAGRHQPAAVRRRQPGGGRLRRPCRLAGPARRVCARQGRAGGAGLRLARRRMAVRADPAGGRRAGCRHPAAGAPRRVGGGRVPRQARERRPRHRRPHRLWRADGRRDLAPRGGRGAAPGAGPARRGRLPAGRDGGGAGPGLARYSSPRGGGPWARGGFQPQGQVRLRRTARAAHRFGRGDGGG